jgi:hypothetical protein
MPAEMPTVLAITAGDVGWFGIETSSVPAVTTLGWQLMGHVAYRVSFARGVLALTLGLGWSFNLKRQATTWRPT